MPFYNFICSGCGSKQEVKRSMNRCDVPTLCVCGAVMRRDFQADIPFASGDYHNGAIHSDSLAISPDQRAEHLQKFPNIKLDNQNRPVFDNFQNHQTYLDKCNIVKERKKIRPKGKRIA